MSKYFLIIKRVLQTVIPITLFVVGLGCQGQSDLPENTAATIVPADQNTAEVELRDMAFATLPPPTIVVVQQTPTPLPTPTPTPTPTPIVYAIQDGDTLLGIALQNQTTVEEIQLMNPSLRPELLSIGQEVVLPPPATPVFNGEQPTPYPITIEVVSNSLYPDGAGGLWVMGEVQNKTGLAIENLKLGVTLFGPAGGAVAELEVWAARKLLQPDEKSPFGVLIPQKPAGLLQANIEMSEAFIAPARLGLADGLILQDLNFQMEGSVTTISGRVQNQSEFESPSSEILVTLYDSANQIAGFANINVVTIQAESEVLFEHQLIPPGKNISRIDGIIQAPSATN